MDVMRRRAETELEYIQREVAKAERRIEEMRQREMRLTAFLAVWDELAPDDGSGDDEHRKPLDNESLSQFEAAKIALRLEARPMGPKEISEAMLRHGFPYEGEPETLAASVRGALHRTYQDDPDVVKPAKGKYALAEWSEAEGEETPSMFDDVDEETPAPVNTGTGA